jgi:Protein O-mannosyl-transferase TMEM260-like
MTDFNFSKWNKTLGWFVFAVALITYWLTVEPTVSFWDAGEYITTASNLEVGHPPGAPLYQLLGAFFSIFAMDTSSIALTINLMSVFASAFAILFMFWSLTILLSNIVSKNSELNKNNSIAILGSAAVGALAFTFTDSFWYSAVEAEVYAAAASILSILFYCGLRWEREMFTPRGDRWLILIAFIIGLSFGVHFMGLLTIPAIGFLYFFKKYKKITVKNFIMANVVTVAILLFIFKLLLPVTLKLFSASELFFINSMGLPFNSGTVIAGLAFISLFYLGLKYTRKHGHVMYNSLILCVLFIFIGFSSWLMLPIRANAGTVINENNPNNARELLAYYNREQYPETHLFYGPQFTEAYVGLDARNPYKDDKPKYEKDLILGKYVIVNDYKNAGQNTDDNQKAILPRMWSGEHSANYLEFIGGLEFGIKREYRSEERLIEEVSKFKQAYASGLVDGDDYDKFLTDFGPFLDIKKPTFARNMGYMFQHQFSYMYWRYFMWNFSGRQNDVQGQGGDLNGNWLSGISFIDEWRLGSQDNLPSDVKNNRARNTYYFLPLILGILGLVFHAKNDKKSFWVLLVFFLFTGLALKIYLNERIYEPRERDYALVGSFYVFAFWIGYGVYALYEVAKDYLKPKTAIPIVLGVTLLAGPILLATQNWDDHDRSNRRTANSMGRMYLDSCDANGILFTIGDNDTFALWYQQNIEQYRQDIRIVNTSLFQTDWYIDDMKKQAFSSAPIPSQLTHDKYTYGTRDVIAFQETKEDTVDIKTWMDWVASENPITKVELNSGQMISSFPSKIIRVPVDKEAVLRSGIVKQEDADKIVPYIDIVLKGEFVYKNRLLMLDIVANNNWERPIYFSGGAFGNDDYLWMKDYLQLDGVVYKLVPIKTPVDPRNPFDMGRIDADKMYDIVMNWDWGNSGNPKVYHDTETRRNGITYRSNMARLAETLIDEGKDKKAEDILDLAMVKMPVELFNYYSLVEPFVLNYYQIDKTEKARKVYEAVTRKYQEFISYYGGLTIGRQGEFIEDIYSKMNQYESLVEIAYVFDTPEYYTREKEKFLNHLNPFRGFFGRLGIDIDTEFLRKEKLTEQFLDSLLNDSTISEPEE